MLELQVRTGPQMDLSAQTPSGAKTVFLLQSELRPPNVSSGYFWSVLSPGCHPVPPAAHPGVLGLSLRT